MEQRSCLCGCGQAVSKRSKVGFVHGHNSRIDEVIRRRFAQAAMVSNEARKLSYDEKMRREREYFVSYRERNREKIRAYQAAWNESHRDEVLRSHEQYRRRVGMKPRKPGRTRAEVNADNRRRYREDPEYRVKLLRAAEEYRRKNGVMINGLSGPEMAIGSLISCLFGDVKYRDRTQLRNPESGRCLELDFFVPCRRLAIEIQGPTHRKQIFGKMHLADVQRKDELKRRLCKLVGITLVEIPVEDGLHYSRPGKRAELEALVLSELDRALSSSVA